MDPLAFGKYRVTSATRWRAPGKRFRPTYRLEDRVFQELRQVERADQELRRFHLDRPSAQRLLEEALTRNAYGTASIEGNPLTLEDVESLLAHGPTPEALTRPEEREILNYAAFMEGLVERTPPRTSEDILAIHAELFAGVLGDAGSFKTRPNFVGRRPAYAVVFVPAMPERVAPELANALAWLHGAEEHPLVRAMVFFHEFQSIHPFRDGNGRVGRALTTVLLHAWGYEGVRYALVDYEFNADRDGYYGALAAADGGDLTPWVAYMAGVLRTTFDGAVQRFLFRERLPAGLTGRQAQVAEWFARLDRAKRGRRVKFADVHAAHPTIAERTLKRDLERLREEGIIRMEGERKAASYRFAR